MLYGQEYYYQTENSQKNIDYWIGGFKLNKDKNSFVFNYMQKGVQRELHAKQQRYQFAYMYQLNKDLTLQAYYDHFDKNDLRDDKVTHGFGLGLKYNFKFKKSFK